MRFLLWPPDVAEADPGARRFLSIGIVEIAEIVFESTAVSVAAVFGVAVVVVVETKRKRNNVD